MPIKNLEIKTQKDSVYEVIPEDVYLCEIVDLEEIKQQKYNAPQGVEEDAIRVKFKIIDGGFAGNSLIRTVRPIINEGFKGGQPSDLFNLLKAVLGLDFDCSLETVNSVIGKQVRCVVKIKTSQSGKEYNHIDNFMSVRNQNLPKKEDIPVIDDIEPIF